MSFMTIIYYLYVVAPFAALFALGYFIVALLGRLLTKRRHVEAADALAPDPVRLTWQTSGLAYAYEMMQE